MTGVVSRTRPPRTSILYQNAEADVTLVDIPTSIAIAQGLKDEDVLLSTPPLEEPFVIHNEPKTTNAKKKHTAHCSTDVHFRFKTVIEQALTQIHGHVSGSWCLPRKLMTQVPTRRNTDMDIDDPGKVLEARLREWSASKGEEIAFDFEKMMASLGTFSETNATSVETVAHPWLVSYRPAREITQVAQESPPVTPKEPWQSSFFNSNNHAVNLTISENAAQTGDRPEEYRFRIPPKAGLFLGDSAHPDAFRASFKALTEEYTLPRHFDFILLDPPWPNGSVKHKGGYEQVGGMPHMRRTLSRMDVDNYIEHNGIVGIWITNKDSARNFVVGPGGLFEEWNVGLIEEWIWVKTTTRGRPMFDMDNVLRKPYETLLLARAAPNSWTRMAAAPEVKTRVIAAVPDIHSRKPCIKELIEPYLPDDYTALEIFSRYLVAGWSSWGNEVIKYNWEKYWSRGPGDS